MSASPPDGTALATAPGVPTSRYQAVRAVHTRASTSEWLKARPYRSAPSLVVTSAILLLAGYPRERVAAVFAVQAALFLHALFISGRARSSRDGVRSLFVSHIILATGQTAVVALTGGLQSPLWPGILGATIGTFHVYGRGRETRIAGAYAAVLVLVVALLPEAVAGPPIARPYHVVLGAWAMLFTLYLLYVSTVTLSDAYERIGETLARTREDVIDAAADRARGLECVGAKVAHELKNPLSAVKGLVQLLARGAADDRSRERLAVIAGEVSRMEAILRDYLSFARPLADLQTEHVDVGAVADDVLAVLEARAEAAGVSLRRSGGRVDVVGDPRRLKAALLNLIANALEATPPHGSVEVAVSGDAREATLLVRDTGKGMAPEDLARLGTPFFTRREGGTGLGVVLARAAIRQHGGDVVFESEVGRGTVATVRLPVRGSSPAEGAAMPLGPPVREAGGEAAAHG